MRGKRAERIRRAILNWHATVDRQLPWKADRDPYKIWLSEIIMQQTQVKQGTPYYLKFIDAFPDVHALAAATLDEILRLWQGLGYYQRARNMHETARRISLDMGGAFPTTYAQLLDLKGVGQYTAAAIASFAYDLPHAVVDGNVIRVLSRLEGIADPVNEQRVLKDIQNRADTLLDRGDPGAFNQAMMDFGSLVCKPKSPHCLACGLQADCRAFGKNMQSDIPVKKRPKSKRTRFLHYFLLNHGTHVCIRKRGKDDIWPELYEFFLIESNAPSEAKELLRQIPGRFIAPMHAVHKRHQLSHQTLECVFIELEMLDSVCPAGFQNVPRSTLNAYAFPRALDWYLSNKDVTLKLLF